MHPIDLIYWLIFTICQWLSGFCGPYEVVKSIYHGFSPHKNSDNLNILYRMEFSWKSVINRVFYFIWTFAEVNYPESVYLYKWLYGCVDVSNQFHGHVRLDWKSPRKQQRVPLFLFWNNSHDFELAVSQLATFAFVNSFLIMLENLHAQGENIKLRKYSYKSALIELAREWSKECIATWERPQRANFTARIRQTVPYIFQMNYKLTYLMADIILKDHQICLFLVFKE